MDFLALLRAIFALIVVIGLILAASVAMRRYAPQLIAKLHMERGERRLKVIETLVLDPARRLILVQIDDEERLLLLGEGAELIEPRAKTLRRRPPAETAASGPRP